MTRLQMIILAMLSALAACADPKPQDSSPFYLAPAAQIGHGATSPGPGFGSAGSRGQRGGGTSLGGGAGG